MKYPLEQRKHVFTSSIHSCRVHSRYLLYKTQQHAFGIKAVDKRVFMRTIVSSSKSMLYEVCEIAKLEMKEKREDELGSWKHAADGTWRVA